MPKLLSAAAAASAFLCAALLGVSSPSQAQELPGGGIATAMLAVAAPLTTIQVVLPDLGTPLASAPAPAEKPSPATLAALVAEHEASDTGGDEHECLANAVYFESRGEPLEGQLAIAQVILNRAHSGRFADSACGVVKQRSQFSFVHGGALPGAHRDGPAWRVAVAVAAVAAGQLWKPVVKDALYFGCGAGGKTRVASLGHHVFYR